MPVFSLHVAPLYLGFHLLFSIVLIMLVVRKRRADKTGLGLGDSPKSPLARAVRAHGNHMEHVPLALLMLVVLEIMKAPLWLLHALGIILLLSRLGHLQGLNSSWGTSKGRVLGMLGTMLVYLVGALCCFYYGLT